MTQEYTPVAWQDETTSQQGTLINAERLNQMQQAHHYADGLEEVDAVPTADPGVSYHKIVYCTADSTIYRWDGTEWTADIDDETKALLQQEIARATEAEGELAQDIADETARATARETALDGAITAEETAREQADTALGNRITAETTARESADTELGADIGAETARARQAEQTNAQAIATHVADKQNPHEVTKAQVGLGNVDNTSDLDKPISTATQTALNEKASTSTVQAVTDRVDTLESAVADRYTKSQTDTLLAGKADQATTYSKTETDTLLAGYVTLNTAQTIPGAKIFTNTPKVQSTFPEIDLVNTILDRDATPDSELYALTFIRDKNANEVASYGLRKNRGGDQDIYFYQKLGANHDTVLTLHLTPTEAYLTAPYRAYDPTHTTDVATIGTLDTYPPMIRTTGNQDKLGVLRFLTRPVISTGSDWCCIDVKSKTFERGADVVNSLTYGGLWFVDKNDAPIGGLTLTIDPVTNKIGFFCTIYDKNGNWHGGFIPGANFDYE